MRRRRALPPVGSRTIATLRLPALLLNIAAFVLVSLKISCGHEEDITSPFRTSKLEVVSKQSGMRWRQRWLKIKRDLPDGFHLTHHGYLRALRPDIEDVKSGVLHLYIQDKSPSALMLNEKADPAISSDLRVAFDRIFESFGGPGEHRDVAKATMVGPGLTIPIVDYELALGTWQGFYLCEFGRRIKDASSYAQRRVESGSLSPNMDINNHNDERYLVATIQELPSGRVKIFDHPVPSRGLHPLNLNATSFICLDSPPSYILSAKLDADRRGQQVATENEESNANKGNTGECNPPAQNQEIAGVLHAMVRHTSASMTNRLHHNHHHHRHHHHPKLSSAASSTVATTTTTTPLVVPPNGLEDVLSTAICPDSWTDEGMFQHDYEGPDDMPGHVKSGLLGATATIPVIARGSTAASSTGGGGGAGNDAARGRSVAIAPHAVELWEHRKCLATTREVVACLSDSDIILTKSIPLTSAPRSSSLETCKGRLIDATCEILTQLKSELSSVEVGVLHMFSSDDSCVMISPTASGAEAAISQCENLMKSTAGRNGDSGSGEDGDQRSSFVDAAGAVTSALLGVKSSIPVRNGQILLPEGHGIFIYRLQDSKNSYCSKLERQEASSSLASFVESTSSIFVVVQGAQASS